MLKRRTLGGVLIGLIGLLMGCVAKDQSSQNKIPPPPTSFSVLKYTDFPNLVLPSGMEVVKEKTMIVKTPNFVGGVISLKGRVTQKSVITFFEKQLLARGWKKECLQVEGFSLEFAEG